ncbi:MAG: cyclase family protein [Thermoplasmata archaeon]|nr:cyclase family protein [Thermoplasmata archaeon]
MAEWYEAGTPWFPTKWGADDQLGTAATLTDAKVLSAIALVRTGRVLPLGHPIYLGMPGRQATHGPFHYLTSQRVYDHRPPLRTVTKNKFGAALCRVEMTDHLGTHLDALNHISYDNKFYNGVDAFENTLPSGSQRLGIDTGPSIVTRGVLVDATRDGAMMEKGTPITVEATERFLADRHLQIGPGDAVLFHTGVSRLWHQTERYNEYYEASPGIGYELAQWLGEKDVSVTGADTPSTEVSPTEREGVRLPVHQYLITKCGIRLLDNLKLDELVATGVFEFLFVCAPLRIKGATASPVTPLAVF